MKKEATSYTVGQVSELAGVTVRMLHHYDQIGLLTPSRRGDSGYRRYDDSDLERLQQILLYRELGFPLENIATILDESGADAAVHLRRQHELVMGRIARLEVMAAAIEKEMEAQQMGIQLSPEDRFEVWGDFNPDDHAEEAEERWGGTEAWAQSQAEAAKRPKEDWTRFRTEMEEMHERLVAGFTSGLAPDSPEAMDLAERHRAWVNVSWVCTPQLHRNLVDMYLADERFAKTYDDMAPGLTQWLHDAAYANADRIEGES